MVEIAAAAYSHALISRRPILHPASFLSRKSQKVGSFGISREKERWRVGAPLAFASSTEAFSQTGSVRHLSRSELDGSRREKAPTKRRVFFLDANPLCYEGSSPSLRHFGHWISIFLSQVSHSDPVIAVSHSLSSH